MKLAKFLVDNMTRKINLILFISILVILINCVSAENIQNETDTQTISQNQLIDKNMINTPSIKENVKIEAENIDMHYKDGSKFTAKLTDLKDKALSNENLTININNQNYTLKTNNNGIVKLSINLNSGNYSVKTTFNGNSNYNPLSVNNHVIIHTTIKGNDFTKMFRNDTNYNATFYDKEGTPVKYQEVQFNINGVFYKKYTNEKGVARLNINLNPGKYIITSTNIKTSEKKSNTITVLPTIVENNDLEKYYRNGSQYSVKALDNHGNPVKALENIVYNINGIFYNKYTNSKGIATLNINLNPGTYIITAHYKNYSVSNKITVKSKIQSQNLEMHYKDGSYYNIRILDEIGNPVNTTKKIQFNINGIFYNKYTNSKGIASLQINLNPGKYIITSSYGSLKASNQIDVLKEKGKTYFSHDIAIPNYVNITQNDKNILKIPKNQIFKISTGNKNYTFSNNNINGLDSKVLGEKLWFISLKNSILKNKNSENIEENGLLIFEKDDYTHIKYYNSFSDIEQFGLYLNKGSNYSETIIYIQNKTIKFSVNVLVDNYDSKQIKNYENLKYKNTGEVVEFDKKTIKPTLSKEYITTFFKCGKNYEEKIEEISYGLSKDFNNLYGFEVMQSFALVNKKLTINDMEKLIKNNTYISKVGLNNVYSLFLSNINTILISDQLANNISEIYNVSWNRFSPAILMAGMNLKDTYQHVINADMGMYVTGFDNQNLKEFRFICSIMLPQIEKYSMSAISERFMVNITSTLENFNEYFLKSNNTVLEYKDKILIHLDDNSNITIIIDKKTGISQILLIKDNFAYKGSIIKTGNDCCSVGILPKDILNFMKNGLNLLKKGFGFIVNHITPILTVATPFATKIAPYLYDLLPAFAASSICLLGDVLLIQSASNTIREGFFKQTQWHGLFDSFTTTRPGFIQKEKFYTIPNKDGSNDYITVKIKNDGSLDRNNAVYYSDNSYKNLSKTETYEYFTEDYWTPFSVPTKYWDKSWNI